MRCPRCSTDNSAGMKFCGQCGAPLGAACPSCGSNNPPEHRFCGQCGAALVRPGLQESSPAEAHISGAKAGGTLPGEMKQVTVLFCDIVNSTALTEKLGPEAMRDLVSSFLATSLAEVHRYGGAAPQFTGDGFMALFGAPLTQEDHVRRALLAALAIHRALGGHSDTSDVPTMDLPVRMGVHTGPVVFGPVSGNLRMDSTAIGDTANVAARLQQSADPGTILLSEATGRLAQGYARIEPVEPVNLKGKDAPFSAYRLLGISHRHSGIRESTSSARATTFVDRESERAVLDDFLRLVESGRGQAVGIVGEAGIGKSRLLVEFRQQLADDRVTWVEGRCVSYGTGIPYLLVLDLLRSRCGILETDPQETTSEKIRSSLRDIGMDPERDGLFLLHLLGLREVSSPSLSNPEAVKAKTFEILRELILKASRRRTLVLVLEDLHWVDKVSEDFLGFLAEKVSRARILLLATSRPEYRPPWTDKPYAAQIPLQPLSRDDSLQVVRSVLRAERLIELVTEEILVKGDGNPFFLEELALHAGQARSLRSDLLVPNTIHDVVMARIDRLPEETKRLLQTAAVIGREFSLSLLSRVCNGVSSLEGRLRELCRLEFVYERPEPEGPAYVFRHALTQEAVYGSLLERHRRTYHGAVGRALEELYPGRADEIAELLAFHFGRSDEAEKAVDYGTLAAEKAQHRWANSEALAYFDDALRRLHTMPDTTSNRLRRIDAVLKQAEANFALGRHTQHIKALEGIRDIVNLTDDPRRHAIWHYWTGFLHSLTGGRPEVAIEHCREASQISSASGQEEIKAFADSCLAQVYTVAGRFRDALEAGERALLNFESGGNLWWAGRTLWHLSVAANCLGEWNASLNYCRRALDHGCALNDPRLKAVSWLRSGLAHIARGDFGRGLECCDEALALAPSPYDAAWARAVRGCGKIRAGQVDDGVRELSDTFTWFASSHLRYTHLYFTLWLAEGLLRQGDRSNAQRLIEDVLKTSRAAGYRHYEGRARWLMAECLAGEALPAAREYADTAMHILERIEARNDLGKAMVTLAALQQRSGDVWSARQLLEQAYAIFHELGTVDEPIRAKAALHALDRGAPIHLLAERS
jgi:class 3 adenylate cyclase/tetratricopeptide (TPR) repeat protein